MTRIGFCLWLYTLITQWIIWLGTLRDWIYPDDCPVPYEWQVRRDRTFYATNYESWQCCDCGAWHKIEPLPGEEVRDPAMLMIPKRPKGYTYRLRSGASPSSEFVDMSRKSKP